MAIGSKKTQLTDLGKWLRQSLSASSDVIEKTLTFNNSDMYLLYLGSTADGEQLEKRVLKPFFTFEKPEPYIDYLLSHSHCSLHPSKEEALMSLLAGAVFIEMAPETTLTLDIRKKVDDTIGEATTERVVVGPKSGLSEDLVTNLNMIRKWYVSPQLEIKLIKDKLAVLYDNTLVDQALAKRIVKELNQHDFYHHQGQDHLQSILHKKKKELFPTTDQTERKDRIALSLNEGKLIILLDGTPFAVILPAPFFDTMRSMADFYYPFWISVFFYILRYTGIFVALLLPSLYVAITSYNPDLFRVELTLSIAGTRLGVPYPSFIEVLLMLLMMEILTEASVRLPEAIGPTATTVGGLILGEAATQAGLVSNIMIIVVAAVAISNYVIPNLQLGYAIRVTKYLILIATVMAGLIGLMVGLLGLIAYLCQMESFGVPYLKFFPRETAACKK